MRKRIVCIISFLFLMSVSLSFADIENTYDLSTYIGEKVDLRNYIKQLDTDFIFDSRTVVQNLNANSVIVDSSYIMAAKDSGKSQLVISNGSQSIRLNVIVESPIQSIKLKENQISLLLGEIYEIEYDIQQNPLYNESLDIQIKWTSNKPHIATIVNGNKITTKAVGKAKFTGTVKNTGELITFNLTVLGHDNKLLLTSEDRVRHLDVGEELALKAQFGTKDVTRNVRWESLTPHVVVVDEFGIVKAVGEGSGEIQAVGSLDNKKATYKIDAYSMIDSVTLNHTFFKFKAIGQTEHLMFNLYPKDKNNPPLLTGYRYVSSNEEVAIVSDTGLITATGSGIALISIIFDDSQKRASCTVEVEDSGEIPLANYIPLKSISLVKNNDTVVIGEKVPLDYLLKPENASNKNVKFNIPYGHNSQIKEIDGRYFFIPSKRGNIKIEVSGADDVTDSIMIPVTSPIDSLDLSLSTRRTTGINEEKLYVGESAELITKKYAKTAFDKSDILSTSLNYEVKNKSIVELFIENNKYYIRALKRGKTEIYVTNLEGMHKTTLWIDVEDPIMSISSDDAVVLPVDMYYSPRVTANTISIPKGLSDSFDISNMIEYNVQKIYLDESFIDEEIAYEERSLSKYENMNLDSMDLNERNNHQNRLSQLLQYKNNSLDGYIPFSDAELLKDRNGRSYKFYKVKDTKIMSNYPVKLELVIQLKNTSYKAKTELTWVNDDTRFQIKKGNSNYDVEPLIKQYGLTYSIGNLELKEKIELLITYINYRENFDDTPSYELLSAVHKISEDEFFNSHIKKMNQKVTKAELLKISTTLHCKYVDKFFKLEKEFPIYYYDVIDQSLGEGLSLNYLKPRSDEYFGSNEIVTKKMLMDMINKIVPSYQLDNLYNPMDEVSYEDLCIVLGELVN